MPCRRVSLKPLSQRASLSPRAGLTDAMTKPDTPSPAGDRIAKVLARAGVASRREAETHDRGRPRQR